MVYVCTPFSQESKENPSNRDIGNCVFFSHDTVSDDAKLQVLIPRGARGRIAEIDAAGDVRVYIPALADAGLLMASRWLRRDHALPALHRLVSVVA